MLFNSAQFIFLFLPAVLVCARFLRGNPLLIWIALTSYYFYSFAGDAWFLLPMLFTTVLDFGLALKIDRAGAVERRILLCLSLCGNLGLLVYFKYGGLFSRTFAGNGSALASFFDVALPAGISFYTFQTMSYVIDVYRRRCPPERNFWSFVSFVSFFPHLVAGPLTRHDQLIPQLHRIAREGIAPRWREGLFLFALGLAKKSLLADRIATLIDPMIASGPDGALRGWLCAIGYALQIYFDFSGYTDMAIGLGRLFGIELPKNFDSPYRASDIADFWRRWHMTLSQWLRDYLYIPLGGSRCSPLRCGINLLITMVLGGLWHGANWTFACWGMFHGVWLIAHRFLAPRLSLPAIVRQGTTFLGVTVGWILFRSTNLSQARHWFAQILGLGGVGRGAVTPSEQALILLCLVGLVIVHQVPNSGTIRLDRLPVFQRVLLGAAAGFAVLLMNDGAKFLYFQF